MVRIHAPQQNMNKKMKILFVLLILLVLLGYRYYKNAILDDYNSNEMLNLTISQPPYPSEQPHLNNSKTKYIYNDQYITFEYPQVWKADYNRQIGNPYVVNVDFTGECNPYRVVSFSYKNTNPNDSESFTVGQKNPHGPGNQTSKTIKINGITVGENIQPVGDGSGGYEPKVVIDLLSKSKKFHFYFIAVIGYRNSFEETYKIDLLPILNSIELLD